MKRITLLAAGSRSCWVLFCARPTAGPATPHEPAFITSSDRQSAATSAAWRVLMRNAAGSPTAVGAGSRTWHAYLSTQARRRSAGHQRPRPHRASPGTIQGRHERKGLADLHGDTIELARLGNNVTSCRR